MASGEELTDEQWLTVEALLPELPRRSDGRGRPWRSQREVLNGVLWILRSGARWKDLPERFPPYQTCHRRYQAWVDSEVLGDILSVLAEDLRARGQVAVGQLGQDPNALAAPKRTGGVVNGGILADDGIEEGECLPVLHGCVVAAHDAEHIKRAVAGNPESIFDRQLQEPVDGAEWQLADLPVKMRGLDGFLGGGGTV